MKTVYRGNIHEMPPYKTECPYCHKSTSVFHYEIDDKEIECDECNIKFKIVEDKE